ncbi:hypothetical protein KFK09_017708 [Dendrobium nobile]|uniref:Uncharacterized protein n=1 Tax=Dendrobium nobile TaxID=94219 RepID=A0A8T3ATW8_DENNO|nr:hypothetical protein KFK09_017708 [Dendrobium nobile]
MPFAVPTAQIKHLIQTQLDYSTYSLPNSKQTREAQVPKRKQTRPKTTPLSTRLILPNLYFKGQTLIKIDNLCKVDYSIPKKKEIKRTLPHKSILQKLLNPNLTYKFFFILLNEKLHEILHKSFMKISSFIYDPKFYKKTNNQVLFFSSFGVG